MSLVMLPYAASFESLATATDLKDAEGISNANDTASGGKNRNIDI